MALDIDLKLSAWISIFGVSGIDQPVRNKVKDDVAFASLLAQRKILLDWKSQHSSRASLWISDLMFLKLEKIKINVERLI